MSRRTTDYDRPVPQMGAGMVIAIGLGAGLAGAIAMTFGEKLEQIFTGRPNSHVPGLTLARLIGKPDSYKTTLNLPMHYGQAAVVGIARAVMSYVGMRGPFVDFIFTGIRLLTDQTLENWTGAGALPWTWPVNEQIIDIVHKSIFAFTTGFVCDLFIQ